MDTRHIKQKKSEIDGHSQPVPMYVAASLVYHQLNRKLDLGVASLCVGGGQGAAILLEGVN